LKKCIVIYCDRKSAGNKLRLCGLHVVLHDHIKYNRFCKCWQCRAARSEAYKHGDTEESVFDCIYPINKKLREMRHQSES
jgi:hypothetical protein